jgi:hypothetical protein
VALGVEDVEGVRGAHDEAEGVEVDVAGAVAVDAADVDDELLVDEDPDVVVAGECELLAAGMRSWARRWRAAIRGSASSSSSSS